MREMLGALESLDNDTRGWIMAAVSGVASVICVDVIIRQFPSQKHFKIEDSNPFLSSGLSLSFGVMIFSALFSMLPSSERYLREGGMSPKAAKFTLIGTFLAGAMGISILSRILHHFIPHSIAPCDHDHGEEEEGKAVEEEPHHSHHAHHSHHQPRRPMEEQRRTFSSGDAAEDEFPFYGSTHSNHLGPPSRRPSLHATFSSKVTQLVSGAADTCGANGRCQGYSNPCGAKCFKNIQRPNGSRFHSALGSYTGKHATRPAGTRTQTQDPERQPLLPELDETAPLAPTQSVPANMDGSYEDVRRNGHSTPSLHKHSSTGSLSPSSSSSSLTPTEDHHQPPHHHHVPTNAFLSIGLQTSCAIALHKIPEGFITYATNHANRSLGFAVFLALFIHNITEGFAMALPLYLAIGSRWKAMVWSTLLGGVSQPLGAGVAALWFKLAKRNGGAEGEGEPGEVVYGVLFAITAGIMAMVGLQLFGEALDLTHSRKLCFASAFVGMGILGVSSALTA
ncbi:Zinc/iron permease [Lophiotrema nucula]|uniref:Zinc/iron permease n=1 Tax=Lophiotrema nucula TaxID=690887 RepID=A0A6A5YJP1_9PLEO|nr:Zinc/iron permease [Lophiotrema nucula]